MRKSMIVLGTVLLAVVFAYPVFGFGPGWGRGHQMAGWGRGDHMWADPDRGPEYCRRYSGDYGSLSDEQRGKLEDLGKKFYSETQDLRDNLWNKSQELNSLLNEANPDTDKVKAIQKEVSSLKAALADKRVEYALEARKVAPDSDRGYGRGHGKGYGRNMWGRGPGGGCRW